jgi:hypothetical protein
MTPPAGLRLLEQVAAGHVLTGERVRETDALRYVLRLVEQDEIVRTTYVPDALVAGLVKAHLLTARERRRVGYALVIEYDLGTGKAPRY